MENMYNLNIERGVLASILFDPYDQNIETLYTRLSSNDFYLPFHQYLFNACYRLHSEGKPIDEEFTRYMLNKEGKFDEVAMLDLLSSNPLSNIDEYVNELKSMSQKRLLATLSTDIKKKIIEDGALPLEVIDSTIKRLESIAEGGTLTIGRKSIFDTEAKDPEFICKNWIPIPLGTITIFAAPGGTGKTWLVLQVAYRAALEGKKVFLWLSEDPEGIVRSRFDAMLDKIVDTYGDVYRDLIHISTDDPILLLEGRGRTVNMSSKFYAMKRELSEYDVIVLDPLLAFYGGDENDNSQARVFMQPFLNWVRGTERSLIFLHHSKKGDSNGMTKARGAGAIVDAVRCVYDMEKITIRKDGKDVPDPMKADMRRFMITKDNYGAARYTGGYVFERQITPRNSAPSFEVTYDDNDNLDMPRID
ncbi:AAA family ATPase [Sulfurovum sp. zt1-1]|uniref:AAA family ATPase n=1 Tax=Sulfurovum zhangzhouensis TaxID=3019067 RepID=A0ABT7QZ42_9BACT|nr:AAA family ATPase [Sulfurovum zhangzhouensis]MDM5272095.1 AAA family ATPase [Sulfurovum zhangzhouensis]